MRISTIDGLRGVAVMGILIMNIAAFALPHAAYFNPLAYGAARPVDIGAWAVAFVLIDGKMRALFSLLFGTSLMLVVRGAEAAGQDGAATHFRRMGWLLLIGIGHFYLLWWGDILTLYAVVGCIAWFFVEASVRALVRAGILLIAVQVVIYLVLFLLMSDLHAVAMAAGPGSLAMAEWNDIQASFGIPEASVIATELARYRGDYAGIFLYRTGPLLLMPLSQLLLAGSETLAFMLLGMAALKSGFITGAWDRARYRRAMLLGYGVGIPLAIAMATFAWTQGFTTLSIFATVIVGGAPVRPFILLGHMCLLILWFTDRSGGLRLRIIAAGRVALTNYLGASIVMTTIFYGYGLGLFGRLGRVEMYGVAIAGCCVMLLWSKPWIARFAYGPFEWIWRSLVRGEFQTIRRKGVIAS